MLISDGISVFAVALKESHAGRNGAMKDSSRPLRLCVLYVKFLLGAAELLNRLLEDLCTSLQLIDRDKLPSSMCFANVSGADHHRFTPEQHHLRGFRSERDGAGFVASRFLQKLNEW